jgi:FixJ family two-component response regulator
VKDSTASDAIVYVVEDDALLREGIRGLLHSVGMHTLGFGNASDLLAHRFDDAPGCIVLDVRLPGLNGLAAQAELGKARIDMPIVFVTGHGDIPMAVQALKAGASHFLTKPFRDQDLLDAVSHALRTERTRRESRLHTANILERYRGLTPRECETMRLVAKGLMNKQIAGEMALSEITVKIHRGRVMKKMGARSVADLVRMDGQVQSWLER